jgi:hypothetical protein
MPFTEEQAEFFFGREAEREIITANLQASRLTLLYGPSGVGKSSVINAGVVHELRAQSKRSRAVRGRPEFAIIVFRTWRDDPLAGLQHAIAGEIGEDAKGASFADCLQVWTSRIDGDLLIVLDQFEEYFLYHAGSDGPGTFAIEFPRVVNRLDLRVSFLVSMREDSIAKLDFFKGRIPNLFDNYLRIDHLERDQARDAIIKPIDRFNQLRGNGTAPMSIEPALVEKVLHQVTTGRVAMAATGKGRLTMGGDGQTEHERVETPYLQLVMTRLWHDETTAGSHQLRVTTLDRLGGAGHIVATHLDAALNALTAAERDAAGAIFQFLVTPSGTKIALGADDLAQYARRKPDEIQSLLLKLSSGENRILTPVAPPPDQPARESYQIFHDVLAGAVLEWRNRYVQAAEKAAAEAKAEEQRLRAEEEWQRAEREKEAAGKLRTQKRWLMALLLGMGILLLAVGVLGYIASTQRKQIQTTAAKLTELQQIFFDADAEVKRLMARSNEAQAAAVAGFLEAQRLSEEATEAARKGDTLRSSQLTAKAKAVSTQAQTATDEYDQINTQIAQQQKVSANAKQAAEDLSKQLPTGGSAFPLPGGTGITLPPTEPKSTGKDKGTPDTGTKDTPPPKETPPPARPTGAKTGAYRDAFKRAFNSYQRRQWAEAKKGFEEALSDYGVDTGESINISGIGNNQPYLPKYFLGVTLRNLGDCAGAQRLWAESLQDGKIQGTNQFKSLEQERAKCQ